MSRFTNPEPSRQPQVDPAPPATSSDLPATVLVAVESDVSESFVDDAREVFNSYTHPKITDVVVVPAEHELPVRIQFDTLLSDHTDIDVNQAMMFLQTKLGYEALHFSMIISPANNPHPATSVDPNVNPTLKQAKKGLSKKFIVVGAITGVALSLAGVAGWLAYSGKLDDVLATDEIVASDGNGNPIHEIKQTASLDDRDVVINEPIPTQSVNGGGAMCFPATVTNTSDSALIIGSEDFNLLTPSGELLPADNAPIEIDNQMTSGSIAPNESMSGVVCWQTNNVQGDYELQYGTNPSTHEPTARWKVTL